MSRTRQRDPHKHRHASRWILLDARFHLLAIGSTFYTGTSPKNTLDVIARRQLLPRMRAASVTKQALTEDVDDLGTRWTVHVEPCLGAYTGQLIALQGGYWPTHQARPEPMLAGTWEIQLTPPGPRQHMVGWWSPSLFTAHDMAVPAGNGPHGMDAPQWLDEVVVEADRAEVRLAQEDLAAATSDALRFLTFRIRSPETGRVHRMRSALWRDITTPGPNTWLRGITMRIGDLDREAAAQPAATGYLEAMFAVVLDPLCAIDTTYEQMFLTSALFAELDVTLPAHRHLPQMCHPDDMPALRAMLKTATATLNIPIGPVQIRLASTSGGWTPLELIGVGVWPAASHAHHVLCRVTTPRRSA